MVCVSEHCVLCALLQLLNAIQLFGANLDDYLHLLLPPIVKLFDAPDVPLQARKLVPRMDVLCCHSWISNEVLTELFLEFIGYILMLFRHLFLSFYLREHFVLCVFFLLSGVGLPWRHWTASQSPWTSRIMRHALSTQ